jgi:predicted  nucleic acid-binding Zn-ribbon protein
MKRKTRFCFSLYFFLAMFVLPCLCGRCFSEEESDVKKKIEEELMALKKKILQRQVDLEEQNARLVNEKDTLSGEVVRLKAKMSLEEGERLAQKERTQAQEVINDLTEEYARLQDLLEEKDEMVRQKEEEIEANRVKLEGLEERLGKLATLNVPEKDDEIALLSAQVIASKKKEAGGKVPLARPESP